MGNDLSGRINGLSAYGKRTLCRVAGENEILMTEKKAEHAPVQINNGTSF
jgi:hypothetical protein